jgi:NAD+-dependent protein deacetylase sirtuin 6
MFLAALQAKKSQLKPTTTIVRPHPCIQTGMEHLGLTALGGKIEKEHVEEEKTTIELAHETAKALLQAKHAVIYTGAGVSTATGISDYRGPNGVWTSLATGKIPDDHYDITSSNPSFTHMAIKKLVDENIVQFVTSTNLDGIHLKSGLIPMKNLAELHGSMFCERCARCSKDAIRQFPVRRGGARAAGMTEHPRMTGRHCSCGGGFMDSGIDFGQTLPYKHLNLAEKHSKLSDFSLVVGTSMRVAPASELPFYSTSHSANDDECKETSSTENKKCCIVNMMDTPKDHLATIRSYSKCDSFFFHLMDALNIQVVPKISEWNTNIFTATQMKKFAQKYLPTVKKNEYTGKAIREKNMALALFQVENDLIEGKSFQ